MKKIAAIAAAVLLAGCQNMQAAVNNAENICKDGVQYFVYSRMDTGGRIAWNVVPHFKPNGTLYTCGDAQPVVIESDLGNTLPESQHDH